MISQRLQSPGTLAQAVGVAMRGDWGRLLPARRRRRMSPRTGGYCRARQRMPLKLLRELVEGLRQRLQLLLERQQPQADRPVFIVDGSSLRLRHEPDLLQVFAAAVNQRGRSHWPVLRVVVLHEARTGLALPPVWGPMYGPRAVSEQALAERAIQQLPRGAVLLGDRNFGIFTTAWAADRRGVDVVLRLSKPRAQRLVQPLRPGSDQTVVWEPSRWDRQAHPELPVEARLQGHLLVCQRAGWREPLYLFTTWERPAAEVVEFYGLRWNIETDLRTLKQTVRLHQLTARSQDTMEKELLAAIAAYNLIRAVICLAAQVGHLHPRELSFTQVLYLVNASAPRLLADPSSKRVQRELQELIRVAATCKLPRRRRRRSYLRAVWGNGFRYPVRKANALSECK